MFLQISCLTVIMLIENMENSTNKFLQYKRFINKYNKISSEKLVFIKAISNVIKSGMNILGVDTPEKM